LLRRNKDVFEKRVLIEFNMGKELEQVECLEDLNLLIRGDRVRLLYSDFSGSKSSVYEVAVHFDYHNVMHFLMPHPSIPQTAIRRYYSRPSKITFDEKEKAFCVHENYTAIDNHEHYESSEEAKKLGVCDSMQDTLMKAGFDIPSIPKP